MIKEEHIENLNKKKKRFDAPDAYVVVFVLIVIACIFTYIIPAGFFTVNEETYLEKGVEKTRTVVDPDSFQYLTDDTGNSVKIGSGMFTDYYKTDTTGILNTVFNGFVTGGMEGNVAVIAFVLIIGGAFSIVIRTGAIDRGIWAVIRKTKGKDIILIPVLSFIFALAGAMLGLAEEVIPFGIVLIPLFVKLGYDSITGLLVVYVSTMIGFSTTWMNPFTLVIAQGIAGLPILSGAGFRIIMWAVFIIPLIIYITWRSGKIRKNPELSFVYDSDNQNFREIEREIDQEEDTQFQLGHALVLIAFVVGLVWIFYGVVVHKWYLGQMAAQFFAIGLASGIIGVIFKLNGMRINDIANSFKAGVADIVPAVMILAFAKGITLVLGGVDNSMPNVLNTILHYAGNALSGVPTVVASWGMYLFQGLFNFLVCSGPAKAGITMPIMVPLSDIIGVSRQVSCLAFQLGDGFTNMINPTSGVLLAFLGIAKIDFVQWAKWHVKMQGILFVGGSIFVIIASMIGFS